MFLYLIIFLFLFVASSFGLTYLWVRGTPYAPYSVLLSVASFQPMLLVCVTLCGFVMPSPLKPAQVYVPVLVGVSVTVFVSLRYCGEIVAILHDAWRPSLLIFGLTMASVVLATPVLIGSASLAFIDWWNGELVSYSLFAHGFLGLLHDPNYLPFFEGNASLRYGAELFLACLSMLTGKAPLLLVEVLSAIYKVSAVITFAVSLELVRKQQNLLPLAVVAADVGFAFATILSLNHVLAFLAAQAVAGSFILLCLAPFANGILARRVQGLFAINVLFILITYAEALPLLCPVVGLLLIEAIVTRRKGIATAILIVFGGGLLANPILLAQRLRHLSRLSLAVAGFNVLGNAKEDPIGFLASALGLRYPFLDVQALPRAGLEAGMVLGCAALVCAFTWAAFRLRSLLFLFVPIVVALMVAQIIPDVQPPTSAYYKSYKMIAAFYFCIYFALAFLVDALLRDRPERWWFSVTVRGLLLAAACTFIAGNAFVSSRAAAAIKSVPSIYLEHDLKRALEPGGATARPTLILAKDNSAGIWDLMANYLGAPRQLLDRKQGEIVFHNPSVILIEPAALPVASKMPVGTSNQSLFSRRTIIPRVSAYSSAPQPVNVQAILDSISPSLRLREDKVLLESTAFRLIDATFIQTSDSGTVSDGNKNQPPAVVGVMPRWGRGSTAVLDFTYSDPNGYSDLASALLLVRSQKQTTASGCYMSYLRSSNQLGLVLDGGKAWEATILGSSKTLENSQCAVESSSSRTYGSGNEFTIHLAMRFKASGRKVVQTTIADQSNQTTGWQSVGFWDVP
jgi:hypothetical protein